MLLGTLGTLGVLVALRSGELTPSVQKKMPFESLQQAFDQAVELAEGGRRLQPVRGGQLLFLVGLPPHPE